LYFAAIVPGLLSSSSSSSSYYYYYYLTAIGLTPGGSSIHLHTNSTQKTQNGIHITITTKKLGSKLGNAGRAPSLRVIPWHLPYNRKKHGKTSVMVVEKCPDIPVAGFQCI
jgi:hypothetical protein